jgi:hypothetical protein
MSEKNVTKISAIELLKKNFRGVHQSGKMITGITSKKMGNQGAFCKCPCFNSK